MDEGNSDKVGDLAALVPASSSEAETRPAPPDDDGEPVEPESFRPPAASSTAPKAHHHHPPPPPSLVRQRRDSSGPGPRFELVEPPRVAKDLMSRKLFTIEPDTILQNLEEHMERFRFGHLPVVDGEKLVGLVSHSDLLHASSSFLSEHAAQRNAIIHQVQVSRIMQRELITVKPDDSLADVATLMWEARVGCVLVVEEDDKLVGIITEGDFLRVAHHYLRQAGAGGEN